MSVSKRQKTRSGYFILGDALLLCIPVLPATVCGIIAEYGSDARLDRLFSVLGECRLVMRPGPNDPGSLVWLEVLHCHSLCEHLDKKCESGLDLALDMHVHHRDEGRPYSWQMNIKYKPSGRLSSYVFDSQQFIDAVTSPGRLNLLLHTFSGARSILARLEEIVAHPEMSPEQIKELVFPTR